MPETLLTDGSFSFEGGADSSRVPTLQSSLVTNGLARNMLAWMDNATVRGGQIRQRTGWIPNGGVAGPQFLFQGGFMYEPVDGSSPYLVFSLSGHILKYVIDLGTVTELLNAGPYTATNPQFNPPLADQSFFCQAEQFLIVQAGDGVTLPLFWDGAVLRRSNGITGNTAYPNINEIPAATAMDYFQTRLWYAQGRAYLAGDIVGNRASGTQPYQWKDSVLKVTENPLATSGDGFSLPDNAGNIRAIKHSANINTQLGQGVLFIATRKALYSQYVPVTRADWIAANSTNQPVQTVVQLSNGWVNDRSVVAVNGDLFAQSLDPAIRSVKMAVRNFDQWYNVPVSNNENRALAFNNRALMRFSSGIFFDNRLWQAVLPQQLPQGVIHQGVLPLDFDIISDFESQYAGTVSPPAWEGMYQGLQILQMFTGDFGGLERAFALVVSAKDSSFEVWEFTTSSRTDGGNDARVVWDFETPAYTFADEMNLKQLLGGELWIGKLFGTVDIEVYYRPDSDPCYRFWHKQQICVARGCGEDELNPVCSPFAYPVPNNYREGYRWPLVLPKPPKPCDSQGIRPSDIAFQFQVRVVVKGWCSVRAVLLYAEKRERALYAGLKC